MLSVKRTCVALLTLLLIVSMLSATVSATSDSHSRSDGAGVYTCYSANSLSATPAAYNYINYNAQASSTLSWPGTAYPPQSATISVSGHVDQYWNSPSGRFLGTLWSDSRQSSFLSSVQISHSASNIWHPVGWALCFFTHHDYYVVPHGGGTPYHIYYDLQPSVLYYV